MKYFLCLVIRFINHCPLLLLEPERDPQTVNRELINYGDKTVVVASPFIYDTRALYPQVLYCVVDGTFVKLRIVFIISEREFDQTSTLKLFLKVNCYFFRNKIINLMITS